MQLEREVGKVRELRKVGLLQAVMLRDIHVIFFKLYWLIIINMIF